MKVQTNQCIIVVYNYNKRVMLKQKRRLGEAPKKKRKIEELEIDQDEFGGDIEQMDIDRDSKH